jgi:hypothetical protein
MAQNRTLAILAVVFWLGFSALLGNQTFAARAAQVPVFTPTPGPDGRILYIVQPNDTLIRISLITGVSIDELRALNGLVGDEIIAGQTLILGIAGPAQPTPPTPGPSPTPTPILPTPSPVPGAGNLCVLLFNDANGDSIRQEEELAIPGGAISINNRAGSISETTDTEAGTEPKCFETLPEGEYTLSIAVPEGYNATTETSLILSLQAGDQAFVDFGAQPNTETLAETPTLPTSEKRSPLLGILGGLLLLAGFVLALFAARILKGK